MEPGTLTGTPELVNSVFDQPPDNPLSLLQQWLEMADQLNIIEPRGLVLSTVDGSGKPSSRIVLLKRVDDEGVIFATSELSRKGRDLSVNPLAAGTLWWRETMQQINFEGSARKLSDSISDEIFRDRRLEAQAVTALSTQSAPMIDEMGLRGDIAKLVKKPQQICRPKTWHAYHIAIESIEFWRGSRDRFHNRLHYDLTDGVWHHQKRQP